MKYDTNKIENDKNREVINNKSSKSKSKKKDKKVAISKRNTIIEVSCLILKNE